MPRRKVPLAWRNLTESKWRLLASVAGTAFAVVLMLLQNGFRNALLDNMSALIAHLDGDLFITNRLRYIVAQPSTFPRQRLEQARDVAGVAFARPLYLGAEGPRWRNPVTGSTQPIRVLAYSPGDDLLDLSEVRAQRDAWSRPDSALADTLSKSSLYGGFRPGTVSELQGRRLRIVGTFALGTDFECNGTVLLSERNLLTYFPDRIRGSWGETAIDIGVLRTGPDADPWTVKAALEAWLPPDVIVLTKDELIAKEQDFWENVAPLGIVFDIGVAMGFIVGLAICYQVLYGEINDRLSEFATLKAVGYSNAKLFRVVVRQAVYLALLGFGLGLTVSYGLFVWLEDTTGLDMRLKPGASVLILVLTILMCVLAGVLAARRLLKVDPAELFA